MPKIINHTDRVIWVCSPDNLKHNVQRLVQLTDVKFHGPHVSAALGAHIYMCNSAGMQVMAPVAGSSAPLAQALTAHLDAHGEGVFAVVYGVPDLSAAKKRAVELGHQPHDITLATGDEPWAAEVSKIKAAVACKVMTTTFIFAEIEYPDHLISFEGGFPDTVRNNDRVDHVAWVSFPENHVRTVELLSKLGGIPLDGPYGKIQGGIQIAISWETGLEVVAPIPGSDAQQALDANKLLERGEGIYAILFGVSDMDAARQRALNAGYALGPMVVGGSNPGVPWAGKYKKFLELPVIGKVMNTDFMYCQTEYPKHIFGAR